MIMAPVRLKPKLARAAILDCRESFIDANNAVVAVPTFAPSRTGRLFCKVTTPESIRVTVRAETALLDWTIPVNTAPRRKPVYRFAVALNSQSFSVSLPATWISLLNPSRL